MVRPGRQSDEDEIHLFNCSDKLSSQRPSTFRQTSAAFFLFRYQLRPEICAHTVFSNHAGSAYGENAHACSVGQLTGWLRSNVSACLQNLRADINNWKQKLPKFRLALSPDKIRSRQGYMSVIRWFKRNVVALVKQTRERRPPIKVGKAYFSRDMLFSGMLQATMLTVSFFQVNRHLFME